MQLEKKALVQEKNQQMLIDLTQQLLAEAEHASPKADYSYIVFPIAKAYEGFLKDLLLSFQLITKEVWASRRFRIGRALNPDVPQGQRDEWWLFDDLSRVCGETTARRVWECWLEGRNHVFHYFPEDLHDMTLAEARRNVEMLIDTISQADRCLVQSKTH